MTTRLARGRNLIAGGLRRFGCTSNGNGDRESRRARFYVGKAETQGHSNSRLHGVHVFQCTVSVKKEKRRLCSFAFSKCCEVFCSKHGVFFFLVSSKQNQLPMSLLFIPILNSLLCFHLVVFLHCLPQFAVMFSYFLIRKLSESHLHLVSLPSFFSSFLVGVFHLLFPFLFLLLWVFLFLPSFFHVCSVELASVMAAIFLVTASLVTGTQDVSY